MKMNGILDAIFPKGLTCNGCGKELDEDERYYSLCKKCAQSLCRVKSPVKIDGFEVHSVFGYDTLARKFVLDYKDSDEPYLCEYIAKYLYAYCLEKELDFDAVCYVPSSASALKRRGYDGMEIVAEEFARLASKELDRSLFRRDGIDQTKVAHELRADNVKDKFLSRAGFSGTVLLLDDVVTTGATLKECADVVIGHGADKVIALTFAAARVK